MPETLVVRERKLAIVLVDLARFTQAAAGLELRSMATLVDDFYRAAHDVFVARRGRIVKFVGDGCLTVFEPDDVVMAIEAVEVLRARVTEIGTEHGVGLELGANIHLSTVAEGEFGVQGTPEVVGMGVVHTFRMGGGPGTRISEPVYRRLPSDQRSRWAKHQPPATYTLGGA
jgi:class 3 adenylate cyclase